MNVQELRERFFQLKNYLSANPDELLDFARKAYIQNDITINEYRKLVCELEALGAINPDGREDSLIETTN